MLYTVIDIETTGFSRYKNDIIQFSYIITDENGRVYDSDCLHFYSTCIKESWSEQAESVHGISLKTLEQYADDFERNCKKMFIIISRANIVGFNSDDFDIPFICEWLDQVLGVRPEIYYTLDMMTLYKRHGIKGKLVSMPDKLGVDESIIAMFTESIFGQAGHAHASYYDVIVTHIMLMNASRKGWIAQQRAIDEGQTPDFSKELYSDVKYLIRDASGVVYEVALCPDKNKYAYYKNYVDDTDATIFFIEKDRPGFFEYGNICLHVTEDTITLEPL